VNQPAYGRQHRGQIRAEPVIQLIHGTVIESSAGCSPLDAVSLIAEARRGCWLGHDGRPGTLA